MCSLDELKTNYLKVCRVQKGLNEKTLKAYQIDLTQFLAFLKEKGAEPTRESVTRYLTALHERYKPRSIRRKLASIKAFCFFLEFEGVLQENIFSRLQIKISPPNTLPRTVPLPTIEAILAAAYRQNCDELSKARREAALRDIAVLELLFATGVRVSELCFLKASDVKTEEGEIKILGKGAKERRIQIANLSVLRALKEYKEACQAAIDSAGYFFVNRLGNRLSDQSVRTIISKYAALAGAEMHITPHMFRHSFATLLLEEDVDIRYIQHLLGHSSIVTTQIYTHVAGKKQRDILATKHPRNRMEF